MRRALLVSVAFAQLLLTRPAVAQEGFEPVVDGFDFAANIAFAPDGTIFVADKDIGEIRVVRDGEILDEPFASVETAAPVNEMGLLGVAVHPDFPHEPWVYAYYSDTQFERNRLVRFRADGDVAVERDDLLDLLPSTFGWHNGGDLAFGRDGKLYVTVGEGHISARAQEEEDELGGRILRLEPDGSVPDDNPFGPDNPTFALGIRNSFGVCVDPGSGDLWVTDNGPDRDDEVNLVEAGADLGWPDRLGKSGDPGYLDPVLTFPDTIVVTGCAVSEGDLFFGEGYDGNLHRMPLPGPDEQIVGRFEGGITDVAVAPDGALWVVTPNVLYRRAPAATTTSPTPTGSSPTETETGSASASPPPSASPSPAGGQGGVTTAAGIVIAGLLIGGLLLMRNRLLRR
jgi:glucose/arabinose dehydrogenase